MKYVVCALAILIGALAVLAGEADDSPGLGGLGLLLALGAVVVLIRSVRRRSA